MYAKVAQVRRSAPYPPVYQSSRRSGGPVFDDCRSARKPRPQDDVPPGLNSDGSAGTVGSGVAARSEASRAARTAGGVAISRQGGSSASAAARAARFFRSLHLLLRLVFCLFLRVGIRGRDDRLGRRLDVTSCGRHRRRHGARLGVVAGRRRAGRERVDVRGPAGRRPAAAKASPK